MNLSAAAGYDSLGNLSALAGTGFTNIFSGTTGGLVTNTQTAVGGIQLSRSVIWSAQAGKPARVEYTLGGQFLRRWQYAFTNGLIASVSRSGGDGYCTAYTYDNARQLRGASSSTTNGTALAGLTFAYQYNLAGDTTNYGRVGWQNIARVTTNDLQTVRIWQTNVHLLGRVSASASTVAAFTSYNTNRIAATVIDGLYYSAPGVPVTPASGIATVIATPQGGTAETASVAFSLPASQEVPSYNRRGMILSDSRRQYTWDAAGRLLGISNSGVSNAVKVAFQYYPDGRRALKTVSCFTNNAWVVQRSLHCAWQGWKLAAECERDNAGTITAVRHFVWGPDIAGQQTASLESGAEGVGGLLLIREWKPGRGMKQYLPLTDGLGSVCGLIDATDGSLAAEYDYDPYGGPVIERGIAVDACPFRHRTRYYDSESWLYYYGYRYFDPSTTKWISKDPLGEAGGWNLTCFCGNDPVNGFDPLGLEIHSVPDLQLIPGTYIYAPSGWSPYAYGDKWHEEFLAGAWNMVSLVNNTCGKMLEAGNEFDYLVKRTTGTSLDEWQVTAQTSTPGFFGDDLIIGVPFLLSKVDDVARGSIRVANKAEDAISGLRIRKSSVGSKVTSPSAHLPCGPRKDLLTSPSSSAGAGGAVSDSTFNNIMRQAEAVDVSTPRDGAVCWTGYELGNKQLAIEWAQANGKYTLELTPGGRWLESLDLYGANSPLTRSQADAVVVRLSEKFTDGASGQVNAFTRGTFKTRDSIFYKTELPRLRSNPDVKPTITYRGY